jgi:hypothetical protein
VLVKSHNSLAAFVLNAQMPSDSALSLCRMFLRYCFDFSFQSQIFGKLVAGSINVLALDTQGLRPKTLVFGSLDYLDFF